MKKVFIIGNGFDINLGLRTSYSDFLKSDTFNTKLIKCGNELAEYLKRSFEEASWIDIEKSLVPYAERIKDYDLFRLEYKRLREALIEYLSSLNFLEIDRKSKAYILLKDNIGNLNDSIIYNFNYTPTLNNILVEFGIKEEEVNKCLVNIHGTINEENIIFGIHDGAGMSPAKTLIKKSAQKNYSGTHTDIYSIMNECSDIIIFGYSLGETDEMYFKRIFSMYAVDLGNKINLELYHYGEDAFEKFNSRVDHLTNGNISGFRRKINLKPINIKDK